MGYWLGRGRYGRRRARNEQLRVDSLTCCDLDDSTPPPPIRRARTGAPPPPQNTHPNPPPPQSAPPGPGFAPIAVVFRFWNLVAIDTATTIAREKLVTRVVRLISELHRAAAWGECDVYR